jgi:hypothetical protein
MVAGSALDALSLTGNVETDFVSPEAVIVADGATPDVGLPPAWPFATSGWDIKDFRFVYDAEKDILYVGINFFGIAGDADGNGNPSGSSAELISRGGQDLADLASSEAIQILFDWNGDGEFDTIAGVPTDAMRILVPDVFVSERRSASLSAISTCLPARNGLTTARPSENVLRE